MITAGAIIISRFLIAAADSVVQFCPPLIVVNVPHGPHQKPRMRPFELLVMTLSREYSYFLRSPPNEGR